MSYLVADRLQEPKAKKASYAPKLVEISSGGFQLASVDEQIKQHDLQQQHLSIFTSVVKATKDRVMQQEADLREKEKAKAKRDFVLRSVIKDIKAV